jgi:hypothetical protein
MPQDSINPYKSPSQPSAPLTAQPSTERGTATRRLVAFGSIALAVVSLLLTGALFVWIISTQSRFNRIFADFGTKTPMLTDMVRSTPFVWLAGALFGLTCIKELFLKSRTVKATWNVLAILAALFLGALYQVGMFQALTKLIGELSK